MPRIASSVVEDIKQLNIVDIISPHVELTQAGRSIKGLCPFHSEKTPSFHVHEDRGIFKCFGCNEAGDAITFIMKHLNLDYVDAVTYICENFGIEMRYEDGGMPDKSGKELKNLHEAVLEFARKELYAPVGAKALEYLYSRGFEKELLDTFELGFLPQDLSASRFEKTFSRSILTESGIFYEGRYGLRCFFGGRIIFPIQSATGACVGFSGRAMEPGEKAKYKNSPETPVFSKRRELFNLHRAKEHMKEDKTCYIVEGYFDAMRMAAAGYPQTVAIMGTAFTREQVTQLKRYVEEYNLFLDGDEAGMKAMRDSRTVALETNIYPNIIFLPQGEDPDSFIRKNGKEALDKVIASKEDLLAYTIRTEREKGTDANRKFHRLAGMKRMLELIKDPYRREYYATKTAEYFEVGLETLKADVNINRAKTVITQRNTRQGNLNFLCEKDLIGILFQLSEELVLSVIDELEEGHFEDEGIRKVFNKVIEFSGRNDNISGLLNDPEVGEYIAELIIRESPVDDLYAAAVNNKNQILLNYYEKERIAYKRKIAAIHDDMEKIEMLKTHRELLNKINRLQSMIIK